MIVIVAGYVFPVAWAASMSLRTNEHMFDADQLFPHPFTLEHYANLFAILPDFWLYFGNTAVIVIFGTAGTLFASALAGYGLARKAFPGSGAVLALLLLTLMVPGQVTLIPQYVWFRDLGWIDTPLPIIVPLLFGTSIATFFFRQFYLTLPRELEDAAAVDGAGPFRTYFQVIFPLSGPAFLAVGLLELRTAVEQLLRQLALPHIPGQLGRDAGAPVAGGSLQQPVRRDHGRRHSRIGARHRAVPHLPALDRPRDRGQRPRQLRRASGIAVPTVAHQERVIASQTTGPHASHGLRGLHASRGSSAVA